MTNWEGLTWTIRRASGAGADAIRKDGETNEFWLEPRMVDGRIAYYSVVHEPDSMSRFWASCRLVPRGCATLHWSGGALPLDPQAWDPQTHGVMVTNFLADHANNSTRRLEGDFQVCGKSEAVTLYVAEHALGGVWPLLIVSLVDDTPQGVGQQSGNGTGDPK
jgi:hypothetical protein